MPIRTFNKIKLQLVLSAKNAYYSLFTFKSPMENLLFSTTIWMINRNFTEDLVAIREVLWLMMIERRVKLFNLHGYCSTQPWLIRGGTPLYKPYRYVPPHRVWFFAPFGLKTGIHFAHFGLESCMVFEGTTECMNVLHRFNSKLMSKKEREICQFEMDLNIFFVCALI